VLFLRLHHSFSVLRKKGREEGKEGRRKGEVTMDCNCFFKAARTIFRGKNHTEQIQVYEIKSLLFNLHSG
jgi:hypothetical protein